MIDFSKFKTLSIDGVELNQLYVNSIQVWKKGYTNLIETATTEPGGTEIYNGTGYADGYRWSLSGNKVSTEPRGRLSGWIPFLSGATYRVKNFNATHEYNHGLYFVMQLSDGNVEANHYDYLKTYTGVSYNADTDTWTITLSSDKTEYFRLSGYKGDNTPIVTMNEEIPA